MLHKPKQPPSQWTGQLVAAHGVIGLAPPQTHEIATKEYVDAQVANGMTAMKAKKLTRGDLLKKHGNHHAQLGEDPVAVYVCESDIRVTLPAYGTSFGRRIMFIQTDGYPYKNGVKILDSAGQEAYHLNSHGDYVTLVCDGNSWTAIEDGRGTVKDEFEVVLEMAAWTASRENGASVSMTIWQGQSDVIRIWG